MLKSITYNKNTKLKSLLWILCIVQVAQSKYNSYKRINNVGNSVQGTLRPHLRENTEIFNQKIRGKGSDEIPEPSIPDNAADEPMEEAQKPLTPDDIVEKTPASDGGAKEPSAPDKPPAPDGEADKPPGPNGEVEEPPGPDGKIEDPPGPVGNLQNPPGPDGNLENPSGPDGNLENPSGPDGKVEDPPGPDGKVEYPQRPNGEVKDPPGPGGDAENIPPEDLYPGPDEANEPSNKDNEFKDHCWFEMKPRTNFEELNRLNDKYKGVHEQFQKALGGEKFDKEMLDTMLKRRSIAERALQRFRGEPSTIPAGLNLGGFCMMRMPQSVLFFHRLKLRNNTRFRVNYLHNDIKHMTLDARLSLNDLHLIGNYERAVTYTDPSILFHRPTYGQVEFLLKDVDYRVQGRYRLLQDHLHIENMLTKLTPREILMRFTSENDSKPINLGEKNIDEYLLRMQNDLDRWLKDYFNDFLIFFDLAGAKENTQLQEYENENTIVLNRFADKVIKKARRRLRQIQASSVRIPHFTLFAVNGLEVRLKDGVIRGLDSIYRRSVTTGLIDAVTVAETTIGFSNLKVEYKYDAFLKTGFPPLSGILVLNGDELTARMSLTATPQSDFLGLDVRFLQEAKAQSLTIEGAANKVIANFKHLLEHHIVAIMSSSLINYIHQFSSLNRCNPLFIGRDDPRYKGIDSDETQEDENTKPNDQNNEPTDPPLTDPPLDDQKDEPTDPPLTDPPLDDQKDEPTDPPLTDPPLDDQNDEPTDTAQTNPPLIDPPSVDQNDEPTEQNVEPDEPTEEPEPKNSELPTYVVSKNESVELEFPPKPGSKQGKTMLLNVKERFSLTKLKKGKRRHY